MWGIEKKGVAEEFILYASFMSKWRAPHIRSTSVIIEESPPNKAEVFDSWLFRLPSRSPCHAYIHFIHYKLQKIQCMQ
jgi:hypothetical protein